MNKSTKAESLVGIVVGILILSFVLLGIIQTLIFSRDVSSRYSDANRIQILKQNLTNIIKNIDTSSLQENEIFYIHKNRAAKTYEVFTGSQNVNYKYIDEIGNTIPDINTWEGDIYAQVLWVSDEDLSLVEENQIIRASIQKLIKK